MLVAMTSTQIPAVTALTLGVRNVQRSRDFYVTGLGFREINYVPDEIVFVQSGYGLMLALWNIESMPSEYGQVGHGELAPPLSLGHNTTSVEEVEELYTRALTAGAASIAAPTKRPWGGTSACVADPDGFRWDFVYNPSFAIDDDGTVTGV
jgi:catechol 2,3-dioxygenase-like lactoylglutathione lyase family enzyme